MTSYATGRLRKFTPPPAAVAGCKSYQSYERCSSGLRPSLCAVVHACQTCEMPARVLLMAPAKHEPMPASAHLGTFHHMSAGAGPRCPLTTARATRLAILVTPYAGRVVSPTTPRCVLGRSSSPITQGSRSAAPRLTRLTPARASRLTPVTPHSPPEPASLPTTPGAGLGCGHPPLTNPQPIHEPVTTLMAPDTPPSHSPPPVVARAQKPQ
eukprot:scaffold23757_cov37-Phaeocystis_antarctica.AAC.2